LNYLGRLGWSHGDQEIFSLDEMTRLFDIDDRDDLFELSANLFEHRAGAVDEVGSGRQDARDGEHGEPEGDQESGSSHWGRSGAWGALGALGARGALGGTSPAKNLRMASVSAATRRAWKSGFESWTSCVALVR